MSQASAVVVYPGEGVEILPDPDTEPTTDEELSYDDDDPNLVRVFKRSERGRDALKRIAEHMLGEFKAAWDDSEPYRKRWTADWKLLVGELPPKDPDYEHCANANIPTSLENTSRVSLRLFAELFDDFKNVINYIPVGNYDQTADIKTKHTNWQFRTQIPDFKRQMHRACMAFVHIGDWTCHSYYDPERRQNRHEILTPDEFVIPWARQTTMPDYSDLPWYAKVCQLHVHQLQARRGEWEDVDYLLSTYSPSHTDEPEQEAAEEVLKLQGQEREESTKYAPFKVILWEGWIDLPDRKEQHWVQAHIHQASSRILMLRIHEEPDWRDLERYENQIAELKSYQQQQQMWQAERAKAEEPLNRADEYMDTLADDVGIDPAVAMGGMAMVDEERERRLGELDKMRPAPPGWMVKGEGPERPRRTPIYNFTHAVCLEPLVGNRGLSYGRIQGDLQRAVNALLSQYIDAGTFGNLNSFLITPELEPKGNLELKPGKLNVVKAAGVDDIRKGIMPFATGSANPQLMEVAQLLMEKAQKSMQAAEILSGEPGKSGETYKGVAARIEQATKQLSVIGRKMGDAIVQIAKNNARLNSIFLPDEELIQVSDIREPEAIRVTRQMYQQDYACEITADMRFATNVQKVAEADELMQMVMGMSAPGAPLQGNLRLQYEVIVESFKARRRGDLVKLLGAPPPPPPQFGPPPPPMPPPGAPSGPGGPPQGGPPPGGPPQ